MSVVFTGTVAGTFDAVSSSTTYVTARGDVIEQFEIVTPGASFISYFLAGSIYTGSLASAGVYISPVIPSDRHEIVVQPSGYIGGGIPFSMAASFSDIRIQGTVFGSNVLGTFDGIYNTLHVSGRAEGGGGFIFEGDHTGVNVSGSLVTQEDGIDITGDTASVTITQSGTVASGGTANSKAIDVVGAEAAVSNAGNIIGVRGVFVTGDDSSVTNSGVIETQGAAVIAIGANALVINTGTLLTTKLGPIASATPPVAAGASGDDARFENSGEIFGNVQVFGTGGHLTNTGLIQGSVQVDGNGTTVLNSGTITEDLINYFSSAGDTMTVTNLGDIFGLVQFYGVGDDTVINHGTIGGDVLFANGADTYRGSGGVRGEVRGGEGADTMYGHDGDDTFFGDQGLDALYGNKGNDTLYGGAGDDLIRGGQGDDYIFGGNGADDVMGGSGQDEVLGGAGADILNGGYGDDVLTGGGAKDFFVFDLNAGNDRITDFVDGDDRIDLSAFGLDPATGGASVASAIRSAGLDKTWLDFALLGGQGAVLIEGLDLANVDASDFVF